MSAIVPALSALTKSFVTLLFKTHIQHGTADELAQFGAWNSEFWFGKLRQPDLWRMGPSGPIGTARAHNDLWWHTKIHDSHVKDVCYVLSYVLFMEVLCSIQSTRDIHRLKLPCAKKGFDWITCASCNFLVIVNSHISEALEALEKASASTCLDWLIWDLEVSLENIPSAFGELGTYFWHLEVPGQRRHVHYALVNINGGIFQKFNWYESISDLFNIGKKSGRQASHFVLFVSFVKFMMQPGWNAFCRISVWGGAEHLKNGLIKDLRIQSILVLWSLLDSQETHLMTVMSHVDSLEYLGVLGSNWNDLVSENITPQRDPLDTCVPENKHAKSTKCASRQGGDAFPCRWHSRRRRSRRSTSCCDVSHVSHVSHVKCATTLTHFVVCHKQCQISKLTTDTRS